MRETIRPDWVEFTQIQTLCRKAGCSADRLARVAAKEIIDNALDASPARGIEFGFTDDRSFMVRDFGPGLAPDRVTKIFDITRPSLSSKRWRLANRGALGNGTRVVMGVVAVSGGWLAVESNGIGQRLTIRADGQTVAERFDSDVTEGTRITITFGPEIDFSADEITRYAELCQAAAGSAFGGTKSLPEWFDHTTIRELVRDMPADTSALAFAKLFDLTPKAIAEIKQVAMRTSTADLLLDSDRLARFTDIILCGQKGQRSLKRIGRNARPGAYEFCETRFTLAGVDLPAIVEVWAVGKPVENRKTSGTILCETIFANRTPALTQPRSGRVIADTKTASLQIAGSYIETELTGPCNFKVEIAVTAPELPLLSDGKDIEFSPFVPAISKAMDGALKRAYVPPVGRVEKKRKTTAYSTREAVYSVIEDVYDGLAAAGIGAPARMLMYRCRPYVLELTGKDSLTQQSFNGYLEDFITHYPEIAGEWSILRDDRGHFILPSGKSIGLGTLAVEEYIAGLSVDPAAFTVDPSFEIDHSAGFLRGSRNPAHLFSAVVFVEKEGYTELIRKAGIAERFDVAFCSSKGMPNRAVRRLLDALTAYGIKSFCLHDFDISGLAIAHNLSVSNDTYQFQNDLDFIDMGLRLADAERLGLDSERFAISRKTDRVKLRERLERYGATYAEIEMLLDDQRRVEIDAMTPRQLIDFIESSLIDHGVRKVVPDTESLAAHFKKVIVEQRLEDEIAPLRREMQQRFAALAKEIGAQEIEIPGDLESRVREIMTGSKSDWIQAVQHLAMEASQ